MAGRRRRESESLVEINERADSVSERLSAAENDLFLRFNRIPHSPISFLEVPVTTEEMQWIDHQVGHAVRDHGVKWVINKAPRMLLASLIGTAMRSDSDKSFWPEWALTLGLAHESERDKVVRAQIPSLMSKVGLKTYDEVELGNHSYVSRLRLHAGLPATVLAYVVTLHEQRVVDGEVPAFAETEGDFIVSHSLRNADAPTSLRRFSRSEPEIAADILARICEFVDHTAEHPEALGEGGFSGTNSVPELMFEELKDYLLNRGSSTVSNDAEEVTFPSPKVVIDPVAGQLQLHVFLPRGATSAEWDVSEGDHRSSYHQFAESSTSDQSFHTIRLLNTSPSVSVELAEHEKFWNFDLLSQETPVAFFSRSSGQLIAKRRQLQAGPVYALAPRGTRFETRGGRPATKLTSPIPVEGWLGWVLFNVDLSGLHDIDVIFADKSRTTLLLNNRQTLRFEYPEPIQNLLGAERGPVYSSSPTLDLPDDGSGEWLERIFYHGPEQEPEDVYGEFVTCPVGEAFPLLPDSTDAWVGRYEVRLFKNHRSVETRFINIAEGISLRVDNVGKPNGITFRRDDVHLKSQGLTRSTYQFSHNGQKALLFDQENKAVPSDSIESVEAIRTPQNYVLECRVVPDRLTFRIDRRDATSTWRSFAEALNFEDLDPQGKLAVRIPDDVEQVTLTLIGKKRVLDSLPLSPQGKGGWYLPTHLLTDRIPDGSTILMALHWQYPFSEKQLRAQLKAENKRLPSSRKRTPHQIDQEIDLRRLQAERDHHADLGSIRRESLVNAASLSDGRLSLETRVPTERVTVWAWPVFKPSGTGTRLEPDGGEFLIPEELDQVGPLIVDVHEATGSLLALRPATPSQRSLVMEQPGFWAPAESAVDMLSLVMSGEASLTEITAQHMARAPRRLADLWQVHLRMQTLRHVRGISEHASRINQILRGLIRLQPRAMLEALGLTPQKFTDKLAFFIEFGLADRRFMTEETAGEFHSEPWISLLLELEDLRLLRSLERLDTEEAQDSLEHVREIGGEQLLTTLRAGWQGWTGAEFFGPNEYHFFRNIGSEFNNVLLQDIPPVPQPWGSTNRRRQALVELIEARSKIDATELLPLAQACHEELRRTVDSPELLEMLDRQSAATEGLVSAPSWLMAPYVSSVFAVTARMSARGGLTLQPRPHHLALWAQLARLVPQLVITDLIAADAVALNLTTK